MEQHRIGLGFGLVLVVVVLGTVAVTTAGLRRGPSPVAQPDPSARSTATTEPAAIPTAAATVAPTPDAAEPDEPVAEEPVARPLLMPALISARPVMDFCGHDSVARTTRAEIGDPEPWECLLATRDAGGAAELVRDTFTVGGGAHAEHRPHAAVRRRRVVG